MGLPTAGFEWDQGNSDHCGKHGVSPANIKDLFTRPVTILARLATLRQKSGSGRSAGLGDGRAVFLVFTIRERAGRRTIRECALHASQGDREP